MTYQIGCQTFGWIAYGNQYGSTVGYRQVFAEVALTGFAGVDMTGGFFDQMPAPEAVKQECDDLGLRLVCFSASVADLKTARRKIEMLQVTGGTALMVGGGNCGPEDDEEAVFAQLVRDCAAMHQLAQEMGIPAGFHNHLGTVTETPAQIERFLAETEIGWCADLGHAASGGADPLALLEKWGRRVVHCHLKDSVLDAQGKHVRFCELGRGNAGIDLPACVESLERAGFRGWACVEQDQTTITPYTDQQYNHDYLQGLGYADALRL
ncbi:MAG TPA: sugar phosphate isomerase/epimerase [Armatimonadota bacterium]|jgi:inosose dehydratase